MAKKTDKVELDDTASRVQHDADDKAEMWRQKRRNTKDYALEPKK